MAYSAACLGDGQFLVVPILKRLFSINSGNFDLPISRCSSILRGITSFSFFFNDGFIDLKSGLELSTIIALIGVYLGKFGLSSALKKVYSKG